MANRKKSPQKTPRKFNLSLSVPGLVFSSVFLLLILVWAFILGVIVGRGYHPRSIIDTEEKRTTSQKESNETLASRESKVLKPEELGFYDSLQDKMEPDSPPERESAAVSKEIQSSSRERSEANDKESLEKREKGPQRYVYTYQVGAFKKKDSADRLRRKINRAGFDTVLKKVREDDKTLYRTYVTFEGSPKDTALFQERLTHLGFENFFLQKKKPVDR